MYVSKRHSPQIVEDESLKPLVPAVAGGSRWEQVACGDGARAWEHCVRTVPSLSEDL